MLVDCGCGTHVRLLRRPRVGRINEFSLCRGPKLLGGRRRSCSRRSRLWRDRLRQLFHSDSHRQRSKRSPHGILSSMLHLSLRHRNVRDRSFRTRGLCAAFPPQRKLETRIQVQLQDSRLVLFPIRLPPVRPQKVIQSNFDLLESTRLFHPNPGQVLDAQPSRGNCQGREGEIADRIPTSDVECLRGLGSDVQTNR